jgi:hypothetical protein
MTRHPVTIGANEAAAFVVSRLNQVFTIHPIIPFHR